MTILSVKNLWAQFENFSILRGIDLEVNEGELHLILGVNGSGKSTFGKVLLGHPKYVKTKGEIFFLGEEVSTLPTHERAKKGFFLSHQSPPEVEGVSEKKHRCLPSKKTSARAFPNPDFRQIFSRVR
jgi:Fe-S cluster assembly ATP-binding protein